MAGFTTPGKILMGEHALEEAGELLAGFGKKALIVTGKHVVTSPMMEELKRVLEEVGVAYTIFDGITGEPTNTMIEEGLASYQGEGCDYCIGIGGGSPLDSAKAIAAMVTNPGGIASYNGKTISVPTPPVVAIPTTAGTGSEATKFTIITDLETDTKMLLKGDVLLPALAVVDPRFTMTSPKSVTAATGLDALTHAVEAYTSVKAMPLTDSYAISAIRRILKWLPVAYRDGLDQEARREMSIAALEAGICINNSSVTIVHGMSRPIGALFHVPHGISNAMLLTTCMRDVMDGAISRFADLGRAVGAACEADSDSFAAKEFLKRLEEVCSACQVPTLKEYGIEEEAFLQAIPKMAADAIQSGSPSNCRKEVTQEDCERLYQEAYC